MSNNKAILQAMFILANTLNYSSSYKQTLLDELEVMLAKEE